MGSYVLRGITTALLVTVVTLFAGILWGAMGFGAPSVSQLLDIGLLVSCLVGGYHTAKESGAWFLGGVTGAGYVIVGTLLLALFLPIRGLGFIQVLAEGALLGLVAGAFGGGKKGAVSTMWNGSQSPGQSQARSRSRFTPSYVGYDKDDCVNSNFEWDSDEELRQKANTSNLDWLENSEDKFQERQETRVNCIEDPAVEWPWDRENENEIEIVTRDPGQIRNDVVVWDKCEEKAKPWWEQ